MNKEIRFQLVESHNSNLNIGPNLIFIAWIIFVSILAIYLDRGFIWGWRAFCRNCCIYFFHVRRSRDPIHNHQCTRSILIKTIIKASVLRYCLCFVSRDSTVSDVLADNMSIFRFGFFAGCIHTNSSIIDPVALARLYKPFEIHKSAGHET